MLYLCNSASTAVVFESFDFLLSLMNLSFREVFSRLFFVFGFRSFLFCCGSAQPSSRLVLSAMSFYLGNGSAPRLLSKLNIAFITILTQVASFLKIAESTHYVQHLRPYLAKKKAKRLKNKSQEQERNQCEDSSVKFPWRKVSEG